MGLVQDVFGLGKAVKEVAEVFVPNKTANAEYEHLEHKASVEQYGAEFERSRGGMFNNFVDGLNRLPRPVFALSTVGLFAFSMVNPEAFSQRMVGLDAVPRELWWLLGAVVSFYFGAREMHYVRARTLRGAQQAVGFVGAAGQREEENAAVVDWRKSRD
ncbi:MULTISPECIES: holin family protein [Rhodobacterales]|uniref:holin family protein n=1 Tax=Roseobacter sp. N2S TaxID=2663844 RepID=UPI002859C1D6|nr:MULTISPECIES: holin family protein [Rhodobacterales]MDR6265501.1 hypothetical protein [Roseobacter sp. N2S]